MKIDRSQLILQALLANTIFGPSGCKFSISTPEYRDETIVFVLALQRITRLGIVIWLNRLFRRPLSSC